MPKKEFDFIAHWANYCREHPDDAKRQNSRFINSMYDKHYTWKDDLLLKPNSTPRTLSNISVEIVKIKLTVINK